MRQMGLGRRFLAILLTCVLCLTCAPEALAESATAAAMRLMKTEGTVSIENSSGRSVTVRDDLRLYNGYGVDTEEASYAWINLDDAKLVKEDAVSEIGIRKSGKKLDILVESGNLFFHVKEPLDSDETFHIRTSTMAVGIRGTCGWVKVIDQWTSVVYILEGTVEVTVTDPVTGQVKTEIISGGEMARCVVYPQDRAGDKCEIVHSKYTVEDIEGFVLTEVVPDAALCDTIYADSGLDLRNWSGRPEERLAQDQAEVRERLAAIEQQVGQQDRNISTTPVWANPSADSADTSSAPVLSTTGGGSSSRPSGQTITLTMPQDAETVNNYLGQSAVTGVVLQPGSARASTISLLEVDSPVTVPAGKSLTLQEGVSLDILEGQSMQVSGTVTVGGTFTQGGTLTLANSAAVRARSFVMTNPVPGWKVSDTADSQGYYSLVREQTQSVFWEYIETTKTLRVWGTGTMEDPNIDVPWYNIRREIETIVIESGLTDIAENAFRECSAATSVTIPASVTNILGQAFTACSSLTDVYYGGTRAQWNAITVNMGNAPLLNATIHCTDDSTEGVTWRYDEPTKTLYIMGSGPMKDYAVDIEKETFRGTSEWYEYYNEIEKIVVSDGVTTIGDGAFVGSYLAKSATVPNGVTKIGTYAFYQCNALVDVAIPDSVRQIGSHAFENCSSITDITIPEGVISIEDNTFAVCGNLASVAIPNSVTNIGKSAFSNCVHLESITIPNSVTSIGESAFETCNLTSVTIPNSVTNMGEGVFRYCRSLTNATLSSGLTNIPRFTFYNNTNLTTVTIPDSVTVIDGGAFSGCNNLTDVYYSGTRAQWGAVTVNSDNSPLLNATIHCTDDSTEETGGEAGRDLNWGYNPDTKVLRIWGTGPMNHFNSIEDTPWAQYASEMQSITIDNGVTSIGNYAFQGCRELTDVTIADSVISIGNYAFNDCRSLVSVPIPNSVTRIEDNAFGACSSLGSITIPDSVTTIGRSAFQGCSELYSVAIPDGVISIYYGTFNGCSGLNHVIIPDSVTSIGNYAFNGCDSLTYVYYSGTDAQWEAINVGIDNAPLTSALIQYNYNSTRSIVSNAAMSYTDVPADAWYAEAVAYCRDNNLMNGTSESTFTPDGTLTRAMMVTVLHRLAGTPAAGSAAAFTDVEAGKWYTEAISWANSKGIVLGYDESTFGTNDPVTHEQVALIFQRYSGNPNVETAGADTPKTPATRAEIAVTLMNYAKGSTKLAPGTLSTFSAMNIMCAPSGIALDSSGSLLVADVYHKQVWRVLNRDSQSYAGGTTVQDLYGQPVGGYNDAALTGSYFKEPWAIAPFLGGWAVSDTANNVVRLIQSSGVQTLNGATKEKLTVTALGVAFDHPTGLAADSDGNLYVSDTFNGAVRKVTPQGGVCTVASGLSEPTGLYWKDGVLYIAETGANRIVKVENGKIVNVAGNGTEGLTDSAAGRATFSAPQGVTVDSDGSVYVADTGNGAVRQIKDGSVTTLSTGLTSPVGLLVQEDGLYICDTFARKVFVYQLR